MNKQSITKEEFWEMWQQNRIYAKSVMMTWKHWEEEKDKKDYGDQLYEQVFDREILQDTRLEWKVN